MSLVGKNRELQEKSVRKDNPKKRERDDRAGEEKEAKDPRSIDDELGSFVEEGTRRKKASSRDKDREKQKEKVAE